VWDKDMKDLKPISGLEIKLEDIGLTYDQNVFPVEPKTRTYEEAKDVYLEKEAGNKDLYYMYRYFEKENNVGMFEENDTEYDITVIEPGMEGPEYIKTAGHYHGYVPGTELTYPEVYEVIDGNIEYLIQTKPDMESNVDVVVITAKVGDKVVVPPGYGHVSINVGDVRAVSSNLQKRDLPASADYETYKLNNGGALYRSKEGWENNKNYNIRSLKKVTPKEKPEWGLTKDKPLYSSFIETPEKFLFLTRPQDFDFSDIWDVTT
jgi:glucose-6-phosphate isomerase